MLKRLSSLFALFASILLAQTLPTLAPGTIANGYVWNGYEWLPEPNPAPGPGILPVSPPCIETPGSKNRCAVSWHWHKLQWRGKQVVAVDLTINDPDVTEVRGFIWVTMQDGSKVETAEWVGVYAPNLPTGLGVPCEPDCSVDRIDLEIVKSQAVAVRPQENTVYGLDTDEQIITNKMQEAQQLTGAPGIR